jgi:hypothetical protein
MSYLAHPQAGRNICDRDVTLGAPGPVPSEVFLGVLLISMRYRRLRLPRVAALCITVLALAGCQGGGSSAPSLNTGTGLPPSVTQTMSIAPAGGSVSATLGAQTITVIVPSGALSATGTVTLTVYATSAAPSALQSTARKTKTVGTDSVLLSEFRVTVTGATLLKPLQASFTTAAAPSGSLFRLAGLGNSKFDDVDTVTWTAGTATSDLNVLFPRMSLAAGTLYAFYTEPTTEATPAPTPVITVATTATQPIGMLSTATFTAQEVDPSNDFPYLDPKFTFSIDNSSLGTISPTTGVLTTGPVDGSGNVVATDTTAGRGTPHGTLPVSVSSQRPGNVDDAFAFSGTLSSTTQQTNSNITTQPQTDAGTVALTSTVTAFTPAAGGGHNAVSSVEADTYPLQTITTKTASVYNYATAASKATLSIVSSDAKDSNGAEYVNQYGTGNGILDVLPETAGTFGPNTAALTYTELDQANYERQRVTAADGSYNELGQDPLGDQQTVTANPDFSAVYDARQYSGFAFVINKPTGTPAKITVTIFRGNTNEGSLTVPSWIPASMTKPSIETDVDNAAVTYPAACNVPAKYGTSGHQLVQTINRVDSAFGNLETETTTTYTAPSVGPVCVQLADSVKTFYDYTLQNGFVLYASGNGQPVQLTSASETLTLQSATTSSGAVTTSVKRGAASGGPATASIPPNALAPVAFARAHFEHVVREKLGGMRKTTFSKSFMSKGVKSL